VSNSIASISRPAAEISKAVSIIAHNMKAAFEDARQVARLIPRVGFSAPRPSSGLAKMTIAVRLAKGVERRGDRDG
jgi:hypothetical protein